MAANQQYAARIETITEKTAGRLEALEFWKEHELEAPVPKI